MKNNLNKLFTQFSKVSSEEVDAEKFLNKLHGKIEQKRQNRLTVNTSIIMFVVMLFLSFIKLDSTKSTDFASDYFGESENLFQTDFWNIDSDSIKYSQEFLKNMAYFLFDEGYIWETVELLDQFELRKEESI